MRSILIGILLSFLVLPNAASASDQIATESLLTQNLPDLPRAALGQFIGSSAGRLVVAGGQDGPEGELLTAVFVLEPEDQEQGGAGGWQAFEMDMPLAWGSAISAENSLICIGGLGPDGHSRRVLKLTWENGALQQHRLPD